jgi:hypothetical protein
VIPSSAGLSGVVQPQHQQKNTSATQKLITLKTSKKMHIREQGLHIEQKFLFRQQKLVLFRRFGFLLKL